MSTQTPQANDPALTLAAIRWYAISLEKLAADIFITSPALYPDARAVLDQAFRDLGAIRRKMSAMAEPEEGCPPGYQYCDGLCLPSCDPMTY